jgi:quinol monooxygenase YgiN
MAKRKARRSAAKRLTRRKSRSSSGKLPKDAITRTVVLKPRPGQEILLEAELRALIGPSRKEEGCFTFDIHRSVEPPTAFLLHEVWASLDHHMRHTKTPHFLRWDARKDALIVSREGVFWRQIA